MAKSEKMKVQVEGNLYIESDSMQFIIREYGLTKEGEVSVKTHGYFPKIAHCLNHIIKMKVMESTANTLSELREDIQRIQALLVEQYDWNAVTKSTDVVETEEESPC